MPYIKPADRAQLLAGATPATPGELNFMLTTVGIDHAHERQTDMVDKWARLADAYVDARGLNYQTINDVMGAFVSAGLEMQRRTAGRPRQSEDGRVIAVLMRECATRFYNAIAVPFENVKIKENGDLPYGDV